MDGKVFVPQDIAGNDMKRPTHEFDFRLPVRNLQNRLGGPLMKSASGTLDRAVHMINHAGKMTGTQKLRFYTIGEPPKLPHRPLVKKEEIVVGIDNPWEIVPFEKSGPPDVVQPGEIEVLVLDGNHQATVLNGRIGPFDVIDDQHDDHVGDGHEGVYEMTRERVPYL
jgi:hypothetical protein